MTGYCDRCGAWAALAGGWCGACHAAWVAAAALLRLPDLGMARGAS